MASGSSDNRINSLIWGVVLALAGIGLFLFNLDLFVRFEPYVQYVASALLGVLGVGLYRQLRDRPLLARRPSRGRDVRRR